MIKNYENNDINIFLFCTSQNLCQFFVPDWEVLNMIVDFCNLNYSYCEYKYGFFIQISQCQKILAQLDHYMKSLYF